MYKATLLMVSLVLSGWSGVSYGAQWDSITKKMNPVHGEAFNDKASCITIGTRTPVRLYQHKDFKGKTWDVSNDSYDEIKQVEFRGWWNDTLSSIKVWKK